MKHRYVCVAGKVEKRRWSICRQAEQRREDVSEKETMCRRGGKWDSAWRDYSAMGPESPWDPRLRHPWVWAYRRAHGGSNQTE